MSDSSGAGTGNPGGGNMNSGRRSGGDEPGHPHTPGGRTPPPASPRPPTPLYTPQRPVHQDAPTIPSAGDEIFAGQPITQTEDLDSFGPYKVLKKLGEGGFGIVYACEQREPIRRQVALKVIKLGMDTREVIARFEAERQALALMDHPNVAKVLDAGVTPRGRPFFVMEYVAGMPITEYCDQSQLAMRDRLQLFMQVCQAVQHAHQKGIIHRDLKPSNVLVTLVDGKPTPKVIDFGIAKAMGQHLTERTMFTEAGRLIGTPEYMSPEQAGLSPLDVDTRTDVYALGVLLYELLTGVLPHEPKKLRRAALTEIQRIIREEEPRKPSTRVGELGASTAEEEAESPASTVLRIAHLRQMEPGQLLRELRGDLDWITMKAMEKDRTRRYDTAAAFAADVEHYLKNEPVTAGPPSATYRMRKFALRNRAAVATGAAFLLLVAGGVTALSAAYGQAELQRQRAVEAGELAEKQRREAVLARENAEREEKAAIEAKLAAEQEKIRADAERDRADNEKLAAVEAKTKAEAEKTRADSEAQKAYAAFQFVSGMFDSIDPAKARGREVTVREILDNADEKMKATKDAPPELEAFMREFMSTAYHRLAELDRAEDNMRRALAIREKLEGPFGEETLQDVHNLGATMASRGNFQEAGALLARAVEGRKQIYGEQNRDTLASASLLVFAKQNLGDYAGAEKLIREVIAAQTVLLGAGDRDTIDSRISLADILHQLGKNDEADAYTKDLIETAARSLGADDPFTLQAMSIRGSILGDQGNHVEAEKVLRATLDMKVRVFGEQHSEVMTTRNSYALVLEKLGRIAEAEAELQKVYAYASEKLGMEHPQTLSAMNNLAQLWRRADKYEEAEKMYREALAINKRVTGDFSVETATAEVNLAMLLNETKRYEEALLQLEHAYVALEKSLGATHWKTLVTQGYIGEQQMRLDRNEPAEKTMLAAHKGMSEVLGEHHERTRQFAGYLATLYGKLGKPDEQKRWEARSKAPEAPGEPQPPVELPKQPDGD